MCEDMGKDQKGRWSDVSSFILGSQDCFLAKLVFWFIVILKFKSRKAL